jgi:general secretion pathway protein G
MKHGFQEAAGCGGAPRGENALARDTLRRSSGFTLLELIVVMTLIGLLVGIALPAYRDATQRAKEATLREDLARMREAIDEYHTDKGEYPPALEDLVTVGYLRALPQDPISGSDGTWQIEYAPWEMVDEGQIAGVFNVRSGAEGEGLNGTPYSEW